MMLARPHSGLGIAPFVFPLVTAVAGAFSSAGANKLFGPKGPDQRQLLAIQAQEEERRKRNLVLAAAGGVFMVFVVVSVAR